MSWRHPLIRAQLDKAYQVGDALVEPKDSISLSNVISAAFDLKIPITFRGAGAGSSGGVRVLQFAFSSLES